MNFHGKFLKAQDNSWLSLSFEVKDRYWKTKLESISHA
jgi:hypothetical protein